MFLARVESLPVTSRSHVTDRQTVSLSFATLLDYSVVNVGMVDHQPAVMMYNALKTATRQDHSRVTPDLGFC